MLVALIGGGDGLKDLLSKNFEGFATNSALVFAQPTTKPYDGFRKGRQWNMVYKDVDRLKAQVPELDVVTPMVARWGSVVVFGDKKSTASVKGVEPDYAQVEQPSLYYGRYINPMDMAQHRKVCVLGKKIYKTLFPGGGNPCGQLVRIGLALLQCCRRGLQFRQHEHQRFGRGERHPAHHAHATDL